MTHPLKPVVTGLLCITLVLNTTGCGTVLYPERKGQIDGQLDPAIVALNALGLVFFLIPGVIAFAVDFSNGTIYLPDGKNAQINKEDLDSLTSNTVTLDHLQTLMRKQDVLHHIELDTKSLQVTYLKNTNHMETMFEINNTMNKLALQ